MDEFRSYALNNYNNIFKNKKIAKQLEAFNYDCAAERYDTNKYLDNYEFLNLYKQIYVKLYYNLNNNDENIKIFKDNITNLKDITRKDLNDKWDKLNKNRLDNITTKKKGAHKCPKCKSWFTSHTESQTRSADESMSVFVTCLDCDFRFKYN